MKFFPLRVASVHSVHTDFSPLLEMISQRSVQNIFQIQTEIYIQSHVVSNRMSTEILTESCKIYLDRRDFNRYFNVIYNLFKQMKQTSFLYKEKVTREFY